MKNNESKYGKEVPFMNLNAVSADLGAMIYNSRLAAGFRTREDASEAVEVCERAIDSYEAGEIPVPKILHSLRNMVQKYRNPLIGRHYCTNLCPLGTNYKLASMGREFSSAAIGVWHESRDVSNGVVDRLLEIARDGRVDKWEDEELATAMKELDELQTAIDEVRVCVEIQLLKRENAPATAIAEAFKG
jgi:hypothetical protein